MDVLPEASIYDREHRFMPWGKLIEHVVEKTETLIPRGGSVLDLACGTGQLLGNLSRRRPDITCIGLAIDANYIAFARKQYPGITYIVGDMRTWNDVASFNAIVCTGGLHHLSYDEQPPFIRRLPMLLDRGGFAIVADPYIGDYHDETSRKMAAAKLGYEYLLATIRNGADDEVIAATAQLIANDVCGLEYKTSIKRLKSVFHDTFKRVGIRRMWPQQHTDYGDYVVTLKKE